MNRKKSREVAMKILYQMLINKEDYTNIKKNLKELIGEENFNELDFEYIDNVVKGVLEKEEELDKKIQENLMEWKLNRISKVNLCILRLSIYEMFYVEDIPKKVAVNEAIEISKKYSENKSHKFINGILARFV